MNEITCQTVGRYSEWREARRKGSRVTHHTPGEVSLASWANCWWVMMYVMEKVRLIHWMNSHDGYEQVLCTCSFLCLWFRRTEACSIDDKNDMLRAAINRPAACVAPSTARGPNARTKWSPIYLAPFLAFRRLLGSRVLRCHHFTGQP